MIASNFRKYPEAMALQLVLKLGRPVWNGSRPTTRAGRALRAARGALVAAREQVVQWVKVPAPAWWRAQQARAKALARQVKKACIAITWELVDVAGPELGETVASVKAKAAKAMAWWYLDQFGWEITLMGACWNHYGTGKNAFATGPTYGMAYGQYLTE